jgi:hypothetical protein
MSGEIDTQKEDRSAILDRVGRRRDPEPDLTDPEAVEANLRSEPAATEETVSRPALPAVGGDAGAVGAVRLPPAG